MSIKSELRAEAMERDHGQCQWPNCGRGRLLEMAHIIPSGSGGKDHIENVVMLCKYHHDMHDGREQRKLREYRLLLLGYVTEKHGYPA